MGRMASKFMMESEGQAVTAAAPVETRKVPIKKLPLLAGALTALKGLTGVPSIIS